MNLIKPKFKSVAVTMGDYRKPSVNDKNSAENCWLTEISTMRKQAATELKSLWYLFFIIPNLAIIEIPIQQN